MFVPYSDFELRWKQTNFEFHEDIYKLYLDFLNPETLKFDFNLSLFLYSQIANTPFFRIQDVMKNIIDIHVHYFFPKYVKYNVEEVKQEINKMI